MTNALRESQALSSATRLGYTLSMNRQEDRLRSFDGTEIFYQLWQAPKPEGLLIITHGMAEHSECYAPIVEQLQLQSWNVIAWDLRGHGQSGGQRGFVEHFDDYLKDFHQLLSLLNSKTPLNNRPLVLFGHSMGGLITYSTAMEYTQWPIKGVVLSSPCFGLSVEVPLWKEKASGFLSKVAPRLTMSNEIDYSILSHDPQMIPRYKNDPLRHEKISPRLYVEMVQKMNWAMEAAPNWKLPVFFQLAGDEKLVNTEVSEKLYSKITYQDKQLKVYPRLYHEIYNELGKEEVFKDLKSYLQRFVG